MNLATYINLDLFPLGWVHLIACFIAFVTAVVILMRAKGTDAHRRYGRIYVLAILAASLTALGISRQGTFFFAHWFAVAAVMIVTAGLAAAYFKVPRSGWIHLHLTCMLTSFYILIGGSVNEIFLRVNFLHRQVPNLSSPEVRITHFAVILFFVGLTAYYNAATLIRSHNRLKDDAE